MARMAACLAVVCLLGAVATRGVAAPPVVAAIERGTAWKGPDPRIELPDVERFRPVVLGAARRTVGDAEVTYPVVSDLDLPALTGPNAVIVSRQSFAPDDPSKCSLYFSYRKALYDEKSLRLRGYKKFLVETPLDREWLAGSGDAEVALPISRLAIHTTDELERDGNRWNAPQGYPMLGESSTGLFQGGQTVEVDDRGRIYISNLPDGAGLVRFDPHQGKFEQPPLNLHAELKKFLPSDDAWRRSWDADLPQIVCTRGRVYLVFDRHYRAVTGNGKFETCSGVVSVPMEDWRDADAFRRGLRLHAGCWPAARPTLFPRELAAGETRRLGPPIATEHGIAFGRWRLDLDDRGDVVRLAEVKNLADAVDAEGRAIPPTRPTLVAGLPRQKFFNVGSAGRPFLTFGYGEFSIDRAALSLVLPGATSESLVGPDGRYRATYPGAPTGAVHVRFDVARKIRAEAARYGALAASLSGLAQGPNYALLPIPGRADRAIGVCEYGYYYSELDFSRRATDRKVYRSYLRGPAVGGEPGGPVRVGLGPYNLSWVEHDGATWLYAVGYTGIGRLAYARGGRPLDAFVQEIVHLRLAPRPLDERPRTSVKDYLHLVPASDGRLVAIGRGRPGRGGGAYSAALEIFQPERLGESRTLAKMNRCYGLFTPVTREATDGGRRRTEFYVASGEIRPEYLADIDPNDRPQDQSPKIFVYECAEGGELADLYGFALPSVAGAPTPANLAFSADRRHLIVLQAGGVLHAYDVEKRKFTDGVRLQTTSGRPAQPLETTRPSSTLWTAPGDRVFFVTATEAPAPAGVTFHEIRVDRAGRLSVTPHRNVAGRPESFGDIVRCFLPRSTRPDGACDLVLGGSLDQGGQPAVRVIDDFLP